jgi:hypothetical protein
MAFEPHALIAHVPMMNANGATSTTCRRFSRFGSDDSWFGAATTTLRPMEMMQCAESVPAGIGEAARHVAH